MKEKREESYVWIVGGGFVIALILVSAALWFLKRGQHAQPPTPQPTQASTDKGKGKKEKKSATDAKRWSGDEPLESSGVAWVPGTDQFLFVDDKDKDNILSVTIDDSGSQTGDITKVPLGVEVDDAEDITFDGTYFYVIGSQFRRKSDRGAGMVRFRYDAGSHSVSDMQSVAGLKDILIQNVPELANAQGQLRTEDAINIEGLGWDPVNKRLILGFRNPLIDTQALLVPVSLKDANSAFSENNVSFGQAVKINLEGQAVRSIVYDPAAGKFLIIAGATEGEKKEDFSLWSWDGAASAAKLIPLDRKIKPEGITSADKDGDHYLFMVGDAGYYQRIPDPLQ